VSQAVNVVPQTVARRGFAGIADVTVLEFEPAATRAGVVRPTFTAGTMVSALAACGAMNFHGSLADHHDSSQVLDVVAGALRDMAERGGGRNPWRFLGRTGG